MSELLPDENRVAHTPGPWTFEVHDGAKSSAMYAKDDRICEPVCVIPHDDITEEGYEVVLANARLIAAAPDLLAACKALLPAGWDDGVMDHIPGIKLTRLAIAKAEGRS